MREVGKYFYPLRPKDDRWAQQDIIYLILWAVWGLFARGEAAEKGEKTRPARAKIRRYPQRKRQRQRSKPGNVYFFINL
ncbi:MAG TPA: hypothetical protein DCP22_06505 [Ruminococcaceae bacterium]|nr:hypothetical protein [Oscillospiraceae bacterium]